MTDVPNGRTPQGVQAYRWLVSLGMAIIAALSWRVLAEVDKLTAKVEALQIDLTAVRGEVGATKGAIDGVKGHVETRLGDHQRQIDDQRARNTRQDQQLEQLQMQQWQRR